MMITVDMNNQTKIVFSKSLNSDSKTIRRIDLMDKLKRYNRNQRYQNKPETTLSNFCKLKGIDYNKEISKPLNPLKYHHRFSKRSYNKVNRI